MEGRLNIFCCICVPACFCILHSLVSYTQLPLRKLIRSFMMLATFSYKYYCEITQNIHTHKTHSSTKNVYQTLFYHLPLFSYYGLCAHNGVTLTLLQVVQGNKHEEALTSPPILMTVMMIVYVCMNKINEVKI